MATEYGLYDHTSKQYVWLGKYLGPGNGFQIIDNVVLDFLFTNRDAGRFQVLGDSGDLPEVNDDGWTEVAEW